jgi:hypothetical protein
MHELMLIFIVTDKITVFCLISLYSIYIAKGVQFLLLLLLSHFPYAFSRGRNFLLMDPLDIW